MRSVSSTEPGIPSLNDLDRTGSAFGRKGWGITARPRWALVAAIVAIVIGALSMITGGLALFGGEQSRAVFGNAVNFVLWFNWLSSAIYVLAGVGLLLWKPWAAELAALLAIAILVTFVAFGWHVAEGGAYEIRTAVVMALRGGFWIAIAILAYRAKST